MIKQFSNLNRRTMEISQQSKTWNIFVFKSSKIILSSSKIYIHSDSFYKSKDMVTKKKIQKGKRRII